MRRALRLAALLLCLCAGAARAQNVPVFATGVLTPGHALVLSQTGTPGAAVVQDAGPALAGNFSELGITNNGTPLCVRDLLHQHIMCFGALALGGGLISYNPIGNNTPLGLTLNINGVNYAFPGTGSGNMVGPTSPVPTAGDVVLWNGGLTTADGGLARSYVPTNAALLAACTGPTNCPTGHIAYPNGLTRGGVNAEGDAPESSWFPQVGNCAANGMTANIGQCNNVADGASFFSVPINGEWNVQEFGAVAGAADDAPAFIAMFALGSNNSFRIPARSYTFATTFTSPYPLVTGGIGAGLFCPANARCSNITVHAEGATFTMADGVANSDYFGFAYINDFKWFGGTWAANPANWPANSEPTGMIVFNINVGRFQDLAASGNWGGSTKNPVLLAADNLTDVVYDHIALPQQGECIDSAFLSRVTIENMVAVGSGDIGNGDQSRTACIHIEYDATTIADYPALVPFTTSDHVTIAPSVHISGFTLGYYLAAGSTFRVDGNFTNNTGITATGIGTISGTTMNVTSTTIGKWYVGQTIGGSGVTSSPLTSIAALGSGTGGNGSYTLNQSMSVGSPTPLTGSVGGGVGGLILIETASCCLSEFDPPKDYAVGGIYSANGNANFPVGGIEVNAGSRTGSETIQGMSFNGIIFDNNVNGALTTAGTFASNFAVGINNYYGSSQTSLVDDGTIALAGWVRVPFLPVTIAQSGTFVLPAGDGVITLRQQNPGGSCAANGNDVGTFNLGSGAVALGPTSGATWVASASPSSGKIGLAFTAGAYTITNNLGAACPATVSGYWDKTGNVD